MPSPKWQTAIALDGETRVSTLQHDDGSVSIRIVAGAVSILAAISGEQATFLYPRPTPEAERAVAAA